MLNNVQWDQNVSNENKWKIYNSIIKSIMTYRVEYGNYGKYKERRK